MRLFTSLASFLYFSFCFSIYFSPYAHATEFTFTSRLDKFVVDATDTGATYDGRSVSIEPLVYVKPLFDTQFEDLCDSDIGRADLTITRRHDDKEEKRKIYFEKKIISDGIHCGNVTGRGLYQLPIHRNWFEDKKNVTIGLGDSFSIWQDDLLVTEFIKTPRGWRNKDAKFFTNWEFFEKFINSVKEFPIDFRMHPNAAKDSASFELRQGSRKFTFFKTGDKTWAVQFPGMPWLSASGRFGFYDEMRAEIWLSPYAKSLKILGDSTAKPDNRIKALRELASSWSPDVKYVIYDVLLSNGDNVEVRKEISNVMRYKPTDENFKNLIDALKTTSDVNFLEYLTKILKLRNPKGPQISDEDDKATIDKKISEWTTWRKTLR